MNLVFQVMLTLNKDGQFLGATWFLGALFVVSIAYKFCDTYIKDCCWKRLFITVCFGCLAVIGFEISLPFMFSRTLILGGFYALGYWVRDYQNKLNEFDKWWLAGAALLIFIVIGHYNSANMGANEYKYRGSFVIGACLMSYAVIFISRLIEKYDKVLLFRWIEKILGYFGKKSMDILIWQFVAFRIVIALQLQLNEIPLNQLFKYYPVYEAKDYWWTIYTLVGLIVPILWGNLLRVVCVWRR